MELENISYFLSKARSFTSISDFNDDLIRTDDNFTVDDKINNGDQDNNNNWWKIDGEGSPSSIRIRIARQESNIVIYGSINYWVLCAEDREETKYVRYIEVELKEKFWT